LGGVSLSCRVCDYYVVPSTVVGQKTCMHVHGVFPYLFVRYDAAGEPPSSYLQEFAAGLDKAINVALGNAASTRQHVYKISPVSGMLVLLLCCCCISPYTLSLTNSHTLQPQQIPPVDPFHHRTRSVKTLEQSSKHWPPSRKTLSLITCS